MEKLDREAFSYEEPPKSRHMDMSMNSENMARCETCHHMDGSSCGLFVMLNEAHPEEFELNEVVKPSGYCKAFVPMEKASTDGLRRKAQMMGKEKESGDDEEKD